MIRILSAALTLIFSAPAQAERFKTPRADGSVIHWNLDRQPGPASVGLILFAQGSGCLSVERNGNLALTRAAFPDLAALTVEKYGVAPGDDPADDHEACAESFRQHHTMTQRVEDYLAVLDTLRSEAWWNGQLVLLGGSEGADVVARLAAPARADAAILISAGGGRTFGEMVRLSITEEMARHSVPREHGPPVDEMFDRARANPDNAEVWAGSSLRFCADAIDRRMLESLLEGETEFLLIQGGRDTATPPELARMAADRFAADGRCN